MTRKLPGYLRLSAVWHASSWLQRSFLLLAILVPLLLAAVFAGYQRVHRLALAHEGAARSLVALEQHAANVLDTHSLILRQLDGATRAKSWEQIQGDDQLMHTLVDVVRQFGQVSAVGMSDATGKLLLYHGDRAMQGLSIADRDYFLAHRNGIANGLFVGAPFDGRVAGQRQFAFSIARTTASGEFNGVILTAVPLEHFTSFWRQFAPSEGHVIPLIRPDGALIARYPALNGPARLDPDGPFMAHVARSPRGLYTAVSRLDGVQRINAYSRIEDYPLFISFSVDKQLVLGAWRQDVAAAAVLAVLGATLLVALWFATVRHSHQQQVSATRWQAVAQDLEREVARREQAEEALRQSRKMEAIGQLAGGIAHDFNNLLAAIAGNLELMRMRLARGQADQLPRYLSAAESVTRKASAMTHRLLAFSRRQTLAPAVVDVKAHVGSLRELLLQTVGPSIRIRTDFAPGPCVTLCDAVQLDNALLNLAINARDAMPDGGELTIATARRTLDDAEALALGLAPGEYAAISVKDTGAGMEPEVIRRAFDPFFTTKPVGQGTGLGLSMVYGFVTQSGGQVSISSAPRAGTRIDIYLPAHEGALARSAGPAPLAQALVPTSDSHVLLVDDVPSVREPLAELLSDLGYRVTQADDGPGGLEVLKSGGRLDLLVSDVGLPGPMNGRQLARAGRELRPGLKVLFITGYADNAADSNSLAMGDAEVMLKPFELNDFAQRVLVMTGASVSR